MKQSPWVAIFNDIAPSQLGWELLTAAFVLALPALLLVIATALIGCSSDTSAHCEKNLSVPECFVGTPAWEEFCEEHPRENLLCRGHWPRAIATPMVRTGIAI